MPPVMTGMVACSRQRRCSAAPPRGMIMSTYWSRRSSSVTSARSGSAMYCTASAAGRPRPARRWIDVDQRQVAAQRLAAAAQDGGVAGLEAERRRRRSSRWAAPRRSRRSRRWGCAACSGAGRWAARGRRTRRRPGRAASTTWRVSAARAARRFSFSSSRSSSASLSPSARPSAMSSAFCARIRRRPAPRVRRRWPAARRSSAAVSVASAGGSAAWPMRSRSVMVSIGCQVRSMTDTLVLRLSSTHTRIRSLRWTATGP